MPSAPSDTPAAGPQGAPAIGSAIAVFAPHGRDAALVCDRLRRTGFRSAACPDAEALAEALRGGADVVILAEEALAAAAPVVRAAAAVQPAWSELPVVLLVRAGRPVHAGLALAEALGPGVDATVLERPVAADVLLAVVRNIAAARARQYDVRDLLEQLRDLNETLEERVEERTRQVRELSRALTQAEQRERERIAEVLHDDLQQLLVGVKMRLAMLKGEPELLQEVQGILGRSVDLTRSLATELAPPILRGEDLEEALHWLAARNRELYGLEVAVDVEPGCRVPDPSRRILLYQILRELLLNAAKHAGVGRATLRAWWECGEVRVAVEDEGSGFDAGGIRPKEGFGLHHARERLELIEGRIRIESAPGEGTRVTVSVPGRPE